MTNSRQHDDRTIEARTWRRIVVGVVALALIGSILSFARTIAASADQLRATLRGLAPAPTASLERPPVTPATASQVAAAEPLPPATPDAAAPLLGSEQPQEPEVADDRALLRAGPPSAAEVAQLIDGGLVPETHAEDAAALRAALEAAAP